MRTWAEGDATPDDVVRIEADTINIPARIREIADDGCGVVLNDEGNGSGGPNYADPDTLREMLEAGSFADAVQVPCDEELRRATFGALEMGDDEQTHWVQIEFGRLDDGYYHIAWLWA